MKFSKTVIQIVGGIMCLTGVVGLFMHISQDDGALAISGAIMFAAGTLASAHPDSN